MELSARRASPLHGGPIPTGWRTARLGGLADFRTGPFGSALHKSDYVDDGVPIVNPMQIVDGAIRPTASMSISESAARKLSDFRLVTGDIVIARRGGMGRCAFVEPAADGWLCGTGSMIVRTGPSVDARFLQRVLSSPPIVGALEAASVGSTMVNLNQGTLANLIVPLPPKPEQEAIAAALRDADALIESLEQLLAKKRHLKQGAMQELLTGKKRLPGFNEEWVVAPLDELGRWTGGMTPSMANPDYWQGGIVPWISSADVKTVRLTATAFSITDFAVKQRSTTVLPAKSVVLVTRSGILRKYLPVAMNMIPMAINQDIKALLPNSRIQPDYLLHTLTHHGDLILARCLKSGTTVESIEFPWLKAFTIPVPPLPEQAVIADALSDMDSEIDALEAKLTKARQIKQGMMQELLTGRIRLV